MLSRPRAMLSLVLLVGQNIAQTVLMKSTSSRYSVATAVFCAESTKLLISTIILFGTLRFNRRAWSAFIVSEQERRLWQRVLVPSTLYVVQSNLLYAAIQRLDLLSFHVTYQAKIVTTAIFSVTLLGKKLSALKWVSLVLLMLGVVLVQLPEWTQARPADALLSSLHTSPAPPDDVRSSTQGHNSSSGSMVLMERDWQDPHVFLVKQPPELSVISTDEKSPRMDDDQRTDQSTGDHAVGLFLVLVCALTSGFASVYFELVIKDPTFPQSPVSAVRLPVFSPLPVGPFRDVPPSRIPSPLVVSNLYLAAYGSLFAGALCARDVWASKAGSPTGRLFDGFDKFTWIMVLNQAAGGLLVGYVIKYTDNIVKSFASSFSVVGASIISTLWFASKPLGQVSMIGAVVVVVSSQMYSLSVPDKPSLYGIRFPNLAPGSPVTMPTLEEYLAKEDPKKRRLGIHKLFTELDFNRSGYLTAEKLLVHLSRQREEGGDLPVPSKDEEARERERLAFFANELRDRMDANGDLRISLKEFQQYFDDKERALWTIFAGIDRNNNGHLEKDEVLDVLTTAGARISQADVEKFMCRVDRDQDRSLSFEEIRSVFFFWAIEPPDFVSMMQWYGHVYDPTIRIDGVAAGSSFATASDQRKFIVASAVTGAISRTILAPMDRLRTYMQTTEETAAKGLRGFIRDIRHAAEVVYIREGWHGFFRGNLVNVVRVIPETVITIYFIETLKKRVAKWEGRTQPSLMGRIFAGGSASLLALAATYPIDTVRVRMQLRTVGGHRTPRSERFLVPTCRELYGAGLRSFYRGFLPAGLSAYPYMCFHLSLFDLALGWHTSYVCSRTGLSPGEIHTNADVLLACGTFSSTIAAMFIYPLNLVRTRLQAQGSPGFHDTFNGMGDAFRRIVLNDGWKGLYKGQGVALLRTVPVTAVSYSVYHYNKHRFGLK